MIDPKEAARKILIDHTLDIDLSTICEMLGDMLDERGLAMDGESFAELAETVRAEIADAVVTVSWLDPAGQGDLLEENA